MTFAATASTAISNVRIKSERLNQAVPLRLYTLNMAFPIKKPFVYIVIRFTLFTQQNTTGLISD